jgi:hypothetical protein
VTDHRWSIARTFANIAKLLIDQRADAMVVAMVAAIPQQIFASNDLWRVSTARASNVP